jgi:hypothetical protein
MRPLLLVATAALLLTGCSERDAARTAVEDDLPTPSAKPTLTAAITQGPEPGSTVPARAFVAPADLGTGWRAAPPAPLPCPPTFDRGAIRSVGLGEARGTLTETIATEVDITGTVKAWRASLTACGYGVQDDALGDAGVRGTSADGTDAVLVTGTEGVLVVMHAQGGLAEAAEELDAWADLALGTSCVAAPDGCH